MAEPSATPVPLRKTLIFLSSAGFVAFITFVLASLSAAGIIALNLAYLLLAIGWIIGTLCILATESLWRMPARERWLIGVAGSAVLAVTMLLIGIYEGTAPESKSERRIEGIENGVRALVAHLAPTNAGGEKVTFHLNQGFPVGNLNVDMPPPITDVVVLRVLTIKKVREVEAQPVTLSPSIIGLGGYVTNNQFAGNSSVFSTQPTIGQGQLTNPITPASPLGLQALYPSTAATSATLSGITLGGSQNSLLLTPSSPSSSAPIWQQLKPVQCPDGKTSILGICDNDLTVTGVGSCPLNQFWSITENKCTDSLTLSIKP